jgi:hypothetical protein
MNIYIYIYIYICTRHNHCLGLDYVLVSKERSFAWAGPVKQTHHYLLLVLGIVIITTCGMLPPLAKQTRQKCFAEIAFSAYRKEREKKKN